MANCLLYVAVSLLLTDMVRGIVNEKFEILCDFLIEEFTDYQRDVCVNRPDRILAIEIGGTKAIEFCKRSFMYDPWNCTQNVHYSSNFHYWIRDGMREDAFIQGIRAAGMSHELSKRCLTGELGDCLCDDKVEERETINGTEEWRWKGCIQKTGYAKNIVRDFLGSRRLFPLNISLMRTHNEELGIQLPGTMERTKCYCHGFLGLCTYRTCWKLFPPTINIVGMVLRKLYQIATKVFSSQSSTDIIEMTLETENGTLPTLKQLIYLEESPDYCTEFPPVGRRCQQNFTVGLPTCRETCCGRGYSYTEIEEEKKCNCTVGKNYIVTCQMCRELKVDRKCM